jgi:hypothetical protein
VKSQLVKVAYLRHCIQNFIQSFIGKSSRQTVRGAVGILWFCGAMRVKVLRPVRSGHEEIIKDVLIEAGCVLAYKNL